MYWKNIVFFVLPLAGQKLLLFYHKVTLYFASRITGPSKKVTGPAWGSHRAKDTFSNITFFFFLHTPLIELFIPQRKVHKNSSNVFNPVFPVIQKTVFICV